MPAPGGVWVSCGHNRHNRERAANSPAPQRNVFDTRSGALAGTVRSWLVSLGLTDRIASGRAEPDVGQLVGDLFQRDPVPVGERTGGGPREPADDAVDLAGQPLRSVHRTGVAEPGRVLQRA